MRMRAHAAFYCWVEEQATKEPRRQAAAARARAWKPEDDDFQRLYDSAGKEYRARWKALPDDERSRRMAEVPDPTYEGPANGIRDGRYGKGKRMASSRACTGKKPASGTPGSRTKSTLPAPIPPPPRPASTPDAVKRMKISRSAFVQAQRNVAVTNAQLGYIHNEKNMLVSSMTSLWRNIGADISLSLPSPYSDQVAAKVADGIWKMKTVPTAQTLHTEEEISRAFANQMSGVKRIGAVYVKHAQEAQAVCEELRLPDPDPRLPGNLPQRPMPLTITQAKTGTDKTSNSGSLQTAGGTQKKKIKKKNTKKKNKSNPRDLSDVMNCVRTSRRPAAKQAKTRQD